MLRFAGEGDRQGKVIDFGRQDRMLRDGDIVGFRVMNRGTSTVDVTLIFVDSGYGMTSFFPRGGTVTDNRILPGRSLQMSRARISASGAGTERMLMIAVKSQGAPMDFRWLEQPTINEARAVAATRGGGRHTPLAKLFERVAFAAGSTRGIRRIEEVNHCIRAIAWHVAPRLP
jgi:hypothetical protein